MTLYLGIFDGDDEQDGWVFGHYSDFTYFRNTIESKIPNALERFPVLMDHSECDGEWGPEVLPDLMSELSAIAQEFYALAPVEPIGAFEHATNARQDVKSLYDCFHNVDGELIFEAFIQLCNDAIHSGKPIVLQ